MYGYTCENNNLSISCGGKNEMIKIVEANYGRTTRNVCNIEPIRTVSCIHHEATEIVAKE